jgi:UPF0176 protein
MLKVAAFYQFFHWDSYVKAQPRLLKRCQELAIKGTILVAHEGINGTVAGEAEAIDSLIAGLRNGSIVDQAIELPDVKYSIADTLPFQRMKVRLKKEIVALKHPSGNPLKQTGTYVEPEEWNRLLKDPDVITIDTRNDYEVVLGSFDGAVDPQTKSFSDFPDFVKNHRDTLKRKKIAMFCTGGIRCEKASSYMLEEGFEEVFHLKGGILNYLEKVSPDQSLWKGTCFVFDERVALDHDLQQKI